MQALFGICWKRRPKDVAVTPQGGPHAGLPHRWHRIHRATPHQSAAGARLERHRIGAQPEQLAGSGPEQHGCAGDSRDVTDRESMRKGMNGADIVVHNAGRYEYGMDSAGRQRLQAINVTGTGNVLGLAHELGIPRTVYVSSVQAFGETGQQPADETYTRQVQCRTTYERAKTRAHEIALQYQQRGLPLIIVCPHNVIGANDHSPDRLLPSLVHQPHHAAHRLVAGRRACTCLQGRPCGGHRPGGLEGTGRRDVPPLRRSPILSRARDLLDEEAGSIQAVGMAARGRGGVVLCPSGAAATAAGPASLHLARNGCRPPPPTGASRTRRRSANWGGRPVPPRRCGLPRSTASSRCSPDARARI